MAADGPRRKREVQRRARRIIQDRGLSYHRAMRIAGWLTQRAARDGTRRKERRA